MQIQNAKAYERMTAARSALVRLKIFWGSMSLRNELVEDFTCETAWIDGESQGYNPDYVMQYVQPKLVGLLAHEALHIVLCQHVRRRGRDHLLWNAACDYVVNLIVIQAGFDLPDGYLYDLRFTNLSTEQVYDILLKEQQKDEEEDQPQNPQNQGEESQDQESEGEPSQDEQEGEEEGQEGNEGKGEGEDGKPEYGDPGKCGEVRDAPSEMGELSEAEIEEIEGQIKVAIAQAQQMNDKFQSGELPGGLQRVIKEMIDPDIPWEEIIFRFVRLNAKNDFSMARPNWNFLGEGLYLPSMLSNDIEEIVCIIDTSGSQSERDVDSCAGALTTLMEQYPTKLTVLYVDTQVQAVEEFTAQDAPLKLHPAGGGGTSFKPGFEWIEQEQKNPTMVIYLTDGDCSRYPEVEPPYPVLWVGTRRPFTPPWGELVMMRR